MPPTPPKHFLDIKLEMDMRVQGAQSAFKITVDEDDCEDLILGLSLLDHDHISALSTLTTKASQKLRFMHIPASAADGNWTVVQTEIARLTKASRKRARPPEQAVLLWPEMDHLNVALGRTALRNIIGMYLQVWHNDLFDDIHLDLPTLDQQLDVAFW